MGFLVSIATIHLSKHEQNMISAQTCNSKSQHITQVCTFPYCCLVSLHRTCFCKILIEQVYTLLQYKYYKVKWLLLYSIYKPLAKLMRQAKFPLAIKIQVDQTLQCVLVHIPVKIDFV